MKVRLFANSAEAIVFWLSIGGLIFLALISFYRANYLQSIINQYNSLGKNINPIVLKLEELTLENDSLRKSQDSLLIKLNDMKKEDESLKKDIENLRKDKKVNSVRTQSKQPNDIIVLPVN